MPPSPRDKPPPAPYPSPPAAHRTTPSRLGAVEWGSSTPPSRPSASRSLSSSFRVATESVGAPLGSHLQPSAQEQRLSRGEPRAFSLASSPYLDVSNPLRHSQPPRHHHQYHPSTHLQEGRSAVGTFKGGVDGRGGGGISGGGEWPGARRTSGEIDVHTANVLAKQQAQLQELNGQLAALQMQLATVKGSGGAWHGRAGGATVASVGSFRFASDGRAVGRAPQVDQPWNDPRPPSSSSADVADGSVRHSTPSTSVRRSGKSVSDASTNTVWAPPPVDVFASGRGGGGSTAVDATENWSYEGRGRKSRGCMTDPWVGTELKLGGGGGHGVAWDGVGSEARRDVALLRSSRSGMSIIRRRHPASTASISSINTSQGGSNGSASAVSSLGGCSEGGGSARGVIVSSGGLDLPTHADPPPLPLPSRIEMRRMQKRLDVDTGDRRAPPVVPPATAIEPKARSGDISRLAAGLEKRASDAGGPALPTTGVLIPSSHSAFTQVGGGVGGLGSSGRSAASSCGGEGNRHSCRRLSESGDGDRNVPMRVGQTVKGGGGGGVSQLSDAGGSARASVGGDSVRWSIDTCVSSVSSLAAFAAAEAAEASSCRGLRTREKAKGVAAIEGEPKAPAFARFPLFVPSDEGSPSPNRSPTASSSASIIDRFGSGSGTVELRASRDTFASFSLRGALDGGDEDASEYTFDDDDDLDNCTTVTGTTTGRAGGEWVPPSRWGLQKMSEAVCYGGEIGQTVQEHQEEEEDEQDVQERTPRKTACDGGPGEGCSVQGEKRGKGGERVASVLKQSRSGAGIGSSNDAMTAGNGDRERASGVPEGVPTITYRPLSDDDSSDDEEMRALYAKYIPTLFTQRDASEVR